MKVPSPEHLSHPIIVQVDSLAFGGEGVARFEGMVIFVAGGLPGEKLEVLPQKLKKNFARASIIRVLEPSPHRQPAPCPYYSECGGCQYQHLDYSEELIWKEKQVLDQLARLAKVSDVPSHPIIPSPDPYGYRNRITVHAREGRVGFNQGGTANIIDIERCLIASQEVNEQLKALRSKRPADGHFSLRASTIPISAFFQSNHFLIDRLRELVTEASRGFSGSLVEGYAGGGFFTRALASQFSKVIAIESDPRALRDARQLGLANVEWIEGTVEEHLEAACQRTPYGPDLVLLDPPRTGLGRTLSETLLGSRAKRIVYVSCDPSTMARDAAFLKASYRLVSIQPIDMFPRTAQIETVSVWALNAAPEATATPR